MPTPQISQPQLLRLRCKKLYLSAYLAWLEIEWETWAQPVATFSGLALLSIVVGAQLAPFAAERRQHNQCVQEMAEGITKVNPNLTGSPAYSDAIKICTGQGQLFVN